MKLSEKGLGKLYNSKACYYDDETEEEVVALSYFEHVFEFEPDDFQGAVVLTVDEALDILSHLNDLAWHGRLGERMDKMYADRDKLCERIEQAEATKICEDYNKALNKATEEFQTQEEIIRLKCEIELLKAEQELDNWLKKTGF